MPQPLNAKIKKIYFLLMEVFIGLTIFFMPISKALVEIGSISAIVLWLVSKAVRKEAFLIPRTILISYLIFLLLCVASLIPAGLAEWKPGIRGILKWLQYLGFFCLCVEWFTTEARVYRALAVFFSSMALVTVNGFYQLATGTDFLRNVTLDPGRITRMKSSLGAPNTLAAFYLFAIPCAAAVFHAFKKWRIPSSAAFLLFCSGLILTFSRAAVLGLLASVFFFLVLKKKWKWLAISAGIFIVPLIFIQPLYHNFLGSLTLKDITVGERLSYWTYTWNMIQAHPFWGVGVNLYHTKLSLFLPAGDIHRSYAHNSYLQMWAEIGIFGLLSFLFPLLRLFSPARFFSAPQTPLRVCLAVGCAAFLLQAAVDNHFYSMQPAFLFFCFWGMWVGISHANQKKPRISSHS